MMIKDKKIEAAIVDHRLGNLYNVKHGCEYVGMQAEVTADKRAILDADVVILPGVGAYEDAMQALRSMGLVEVLKEVAASGKPLIGICLGMQLLMSESYEFGHHQGLDIVKGSVVPFENPVEKNGRRLKVPQITWNQVYQKNNQSEINTWHDTFLDGIPNGENMYFVHSYYVKPENPETVLAISRYGQIEFCSSIHCDNVFATQFHPERSGPQGLHIYENIANFCEKTKKR